MQLQHLWRGPLDISEILVKKISELKMRIHILQIKRNVSQEEIELSAKVETLTFQGKHSRVDRVKRAMATVTLDETSGQLLQSDCHCQMKFIFQYKEQHVLSALDTQIVLLSQTRYPKDVLSNQLEQNFHSLNLYSFFDNDILHIWNFVNEDFTRTHWKIDGFNLFHVKYNGTSDYQPVTCVLT